MNNAARIKEARLWRAFTKQPSERNHERLWSHYQPLVRFIADRFSERINAAVEQSELIDAGNVGLLDAIAEYKPAEISRFETAAVPMIRDAISRSLAVQRARENCHVRRLELAEAIALAQGKEESAPRELVLQIEIGRREFATQK